MKPTFGKRGGWWGEADGRRAMSGVLWEPMCAIYSELEIEYIFGQTGWKVQNVELDESSVKNESS